MGKNENKNIKTMDTSKSSHKNQIIKIIKHSSNIMIDETMNSNYSITFKSLEELEKKLNNYNAVNLKSFAYISLILSFASILALLISFFSSKSNRSAFFNSSTTEILMFIAIPILSGFLGFILMRYFFPLKKVEKNEIIIKNSLNKVIQQRLDESHFNPQK